jgi:hypothetical protein
MEDNKFVATGVASYSGQVLLDDGVTTVHALVFTNLDGEQIEVIFPPQLTLHVQRACIAACVADADAARERHALRLKKLKRKK